MWLILGVYFFLQKLRKFEKTEKIERRINKRMTDLLKRATRRFPPDIELWETRIGFCKSVGYPELVGIICFTLHFIGILYQSK